MPQTTTRRLRWVDIAKAVAIAAIVWGHALDYGPAMSLLFSFHVPLFFILSGFTFTYRPGAGEFLAKKVRQLLVPYLVFGLLSIVAYQVLGAVTAQRLGVAEEFLSPLECLGGLAYGTGITGCLKFNLPLWFLPCLFVVDCLAYATSAAFSRAKKGVFGPGGAAVVAVLLGAGIASTCLPDWVILPFGITTALVMLPFFALGMVLRHVGAADAVQSRLGRGGLVAAGVVLFVAGGVAAMLNSGTVEDGRIDYVLSLYGIWPVFYASAAAMSMGVMAASMAVGASRPLEYLGKNTLAVLVMHKFPILLCQTVLPFTRDALAAWNLPASAAVAVFAILASLLVAVPLSRFLPWTLAKPAMRGLHIRESRARATK